MSAVNYSNSLPDELLVKIFKHQINLAVPLVCKHWERVSKDIQVWQIGYELGLEKRNQQQLFKSVKAFSFEMQRIISSIPNKPQEITALLAKIRRADQLFMTFFDPRYEEARPLSKQQKLSANLLRLNSWCVSRARVLFLLKVGKAANLGEELPSLDVLKDVVATIEAAKGNKAWFKKHQRAVETLVELDLSGCNLGIIPAQVIYLRGLESLNLKNNSLHNLPQELAALPNLCELRLEGNPLSEVPLLPGVNLSFDRRRVNPVTEVISFAAVPKPTPIPKKIAAACIKMKALIGSFPEQERPKKWSTLTLPNLFADQFPPGYFDAFRDPYYVPKEVNLDKVLDALRELTGWLHDRADILLWRELAVVSGIGGAPALSVLKDVRKTREAAKGLYPWLWYNQEVITSLPELDLSYKNLCHISPLIGFLHGLEVLNLSGNNLTKLPATIRNLKCLQELELSQNALTSLPKSVKTLSKLNRLDLENNLFRSEEMNSLPPLIARVVESVLQE